MAESGRVWLCGGEIVVVHAAGGGGDPVVQLEAAVAECRAALAQEGLSHGDVALTRLWMADRDGAAKLNETRERLLRGPFRSASSSFFSRQRMREGGDVAIELYAVRTQAPQSRRIADFDPPRRYAHYLAVDDWLFLSGMAEEGATMDLQFESALAQVEAALARENFSWRDVCSASLFLQRGHATADWFVDRFRRAAAAAPPLITLELVDELANTPKHLEIEIIARRVTG